VDGSSRDDCNPCASAYFGSVYRADGDTACKACPAQPVLLFQYGGNVNAYYPVTISAPGAKHEDGCLPDFTANEDGNWRLPATGLTAMDASVDTFSESLRHARRQGLQPASSSVLTTVQGCAPYVKQHQTTGEARQAVCPHRSNMTDTQCVERSALKGFFRQR
jgi:hypothetical protein